MKEVLSNIKRLREEQGLTHEELAKRVHGFDMTGERIHQYEDNGIIPSYDIIKAIARALKVPLTTLLNVTNEQKYEIYKKNFGDRLRYKREKSKLTQAQLGHLIGVKESTIRQYENGHNLPRGVKLYDLIDVLNTSLNYLLVGKE